MVWPIVLIVACEADAVGASFGGTELIIAFMFGLEKVLEQVATLLYIRC
jgi:hypothetical protein